VLAEDDSAFALCSFRTDNGWIAIPTDNVNSGYAMITYIDSLRMSGTFYFDAVYDMGAAHVRSGAFNVPIQSITGTTAAVVRSKQASTGWSRP